MNQKRVKGISIARPIVYGNTATLIIPSERVSDHTHRWTVAVRSAASPAVTASHRRGDPPQIGGQDDISHYIKKVSFKLHETYPNPLRNIDKPPFEVTETGWGEFSIQIKIWFHNESGEKPLTINHFLKLHPWPIEAFSDPGYAAGLPSVEPPENPENAQLNLPPEELAMLPGKPGAPLDGPVHSWQYDELVFVEPTESLFHTLISQAPTPLPLKPRSNMHVTQPASLSVYNGGAFNEWTQQTELVEAERLEQARQKVAAQLAKCTETIRNSETRMRELKAELDG